MPPLELDYQPRRLSARGLALLLAGLFAAVLAGLAQQRAAADLRHWQGELSRAQQTVQRRSAARQHEERLGRSSQEFQQAVQAAGSVADDIRRPWGALFGALEAARSDDVALSSLEPDAARGMLRIAGEAKERAAILAYMNRLNGSKVLKNVVLLEDQLQTEKPEQPFRFLVAAEWAGTS